MSGPLYLAAAAVILAFAVLLVRFPRTLFTEAAEHPPSRRAEIGLTLALAAAGGVAFMSGLGRGAEGRLCFALAAMTFAALVYSDLSFLVIPDLYSLILVVLALLAPWKFQAQEAVFGLFICGGLLAIVAFLWHRFTNVEGLGFGDVKLAAAIGALLSAQPGLFAISLSAGVAAVLALTVRAIRKPKDEEPPLVPYGAALALASVAFLAKGLIT